MEYGCSVALIMATETEEKAVRDLYTHWQSLTVEGDTQEYFETTFLSPDGNPHRLIRARQQQMGMTAASTLSTKLIYQFRPRYLIMVGIAAGVALKDLEEQLYGDVIVADSVWNYEFGKFVPASDGIISFGSIGFQPRPASLELPQYILPYVRAAIESPQNQNHVYIGPIASGSSVVANSEVLSKQIHSQQRETAGLDMEAYAVAYAAAHAPAPKPTALIVKSVCDYADSSKSDQYQKFAAYTAAAFANLLYEKFLPY